MDRGHESLDRRGRLSCRLAAAGLAVAVVSAVIAVLSGLGNRAGWWDFRTGFGVLRISVYAAIAAFILSSAGLLMSIRRSGRLAAYAAAGIILSAIIIYTPLAWRLSVSRVPPIHDITTDTGNPPQFMAALSLRKDAMNPAAYGGAEVAAKQREAYPDIQPVFFPLRPEEAFDLALGGVKAMRWDIVDADIFSGRIEATDTTFWFGFKDDIVIRITPMEGGAKSRVDMRSVSRVGKSDIGTNAKRIRRYLGALAKGF